MDNETGRLDFSKFKIAVATQFAAMAKHELFCVDVDKDAMWNTYLDSFPPGTNNIYRQRREYDCSCCRSFIKRVGNVVAIIDGRITTIWDTLTDEPAFDQVSQAVANLVRQHPLSNRFLSSESVAGADKNFEQLLNEVKTWTHFFINIPKPNQAKKDRIGPLLSDARASHDVMLRSLDQLSDDAVDIVAELIAQGSLYRGDEHATVIRQFKALKARFNALVPTDRDLWVWQQLNTTAVPVARIRNTAIGTLLIDLSEGLELEQAVRKYESVVAPTNYKRPTALVTQKMVDAAKSKVEELGLSSALQRRYASIEDISVADFLFVDRTPTSLAQTDAFSSVATKGGTQQFDKVETIGIDDFLTNVLPTAKSLEVMFEGQQSGNLVSLITAADPSAERLFKWNNPFSWSYNGDLADSIKERVKQAGGNVEGDLCCRLAWYNYDDLDFHMVEPHLQYEIFFRNKGRLSPSGGTLDVDMNAGSGATRTPVENIYYQSKSRMPNGTYQLIVHQFCRRDNADPGFEVEIDILGNVTKIAYQSPLPTGKAIEVAHIVCKDGNLTVVPLLPSSSATRELWGIKTNQFHKVRSVLLSPNYWNGQQIGNKHFLFMLDKCKHEQAARGFYNEFLRTDLNPHRKTLEIVGSKMRTEDADKQLSGLGFSSTKRADLLVRVTSTFTRILRVNI